jgi:hypothetical protein
MELWLVNVRGQPASAHATISHGISIPALNLVPLRSDDGFASISLFSLFSFLSLWRRVATGEQDDSREECSRFFFFFFFSFFFFFGCSFFFSVFVFFFFSFGGLVLLFEDGSAFFLDLSDDADVSLLLLLAEDALL